MIGVGDRLWDSSLYSLQAGTPQRKKHCRGSGTGCDPGRTVRAYSDADDDKCFFNLKFLGFSRVFRVRKNRHAGYRLRFFELLFHFSGASIVL